MKTPAMIAIVMGIGLLIAAASPQDDANLARKVQQEESAKKVKELQTERLAALRDYQRSQPRSTGMRG